MKTEDFLLGVVLVGITFTCFYMVSEFRSWRAITVSDYKAGIVLRDLYKKLHSRTKPFTQTITRPFTSRSTRK
jgi:hypothetical protein